MRTIHVKVERDFARKDFAMAGVAGSGNANHLQITFDESWDQYAKKITWWDAALQNPVQVILGGDKIMDLIQDPRTYLVAIPPEPLALAGTCTAVIDGYLDGKRARTVRMEFEVPFAPVAENPSEPTDPTPSQAEQLQAEIDAILEQYRQYAITSKSYAVGGTGKRAGEDTDNAKYYSQVASEKADEVASGVQTAVQAAQAAERSSSAAATAAQNAAASEALASASAASAAQDKDAAQSAAQEAAQSAAEASQANTSARSAAETAQAAAQSAGQDAKTAQDAAQTAASSAAQAAQDASQAAQSAAQSFDDAQRAEAAAERAETAAEMAQAAVGKTSYIGENGNWYEWNSEQGAFVDTGYSASALLDQNSQQQVKIWFGTVEQYNALHEIRSDTYYNILEGTV